MILKITLQLGYKMIVEPKWFCLYTIEKHHFHYLASPDLGYRLLILEVNVSEVVRFQIEFPPKLVGLVFRLGTAEGSILATSSLMAQPIGLTVFSIFFLYSDMLLWTITSDEKHTVLYYFPVFKNKNKTRKEIKNWQVCKLKFIYSWEAHKMLRNLHLTFVLCSASQK